MPPEPSYLVGGYGEIENEIDNLDNLEIENEIDNLDNLGVLVHALGAVLPRGSVASRVSVSGGW